MLYYYTIYAGACFAHIKKKNKTIFRAIFTNFTYIKSFFRNKLISLFLIVFCKIVVDFPCYYQFSFNIIVLIIIVIVDLVINIMQDNLTFISVIFNINLVGVVKLLYIEIFNCNFFV